MQEIGILMPDRNTEDMVLFPERIGGRYVALVRQYPAIQLVNSSR